jgi:hypothetical protein
MLPELQLILKPNETVRPIKDSPNYYVSNLGNVYSTVKNKPKQLAVHTDSKGYYLLVNLPINGKRAPRLVHRLVAHAFIPNPNNLPEVNHKDKNKQNNNVENLEWCTRRKNLEDSYTTMSPNRNFQKCKLFVNDECVGEFDGVKRAAKFAHDEYGASAASLEKYLKWINISIVFDDISNRKVYEGHSCTKAQNRKPIYVYKDDELVGQFKSYKSVQKYLENYGIYVSEAWVRIAHDRNTTVQGFKIVR